MSETPTQRSRAHRKKETTFEMMELYEEFQSVRKVGEIMGIPKSNVQRRLRKSGVSNPEGWRRATCCEPNCDKRTNGSLRCPFHRKVQRARQSSVLYHAKQIKKK